jgi:cell division protein FtsZ
VNPLKFAIQDEQVLGTKIKVIGVGGGGSNAVARMMNEGVKGVEFHVMNTDVQALEACPVPNKLAIGTKVTNGLGAGSDPAIGRQAALEDTEKIIEILEGADMVFVTAGMGGGTGTGAAPVIASLAKELNALTVAVVTKPFAFESMHRMKLAEKGLADLAATVDTVISVPNEKLLELAPKGTSFFDAFRLADDVLRQAVQGIADIIITPGLINRDFSDIRSIMLGMGYAVMGSATARGEGAPMEAARRAIASPLMEEGGIRGARAILINISGSSQLGLHDVNDACALIRAATASDEAQINFGVVLDESLGDEVKITVLATGFRRDPVVVAPPQATVAPRRSEPVMESPRPRTYPVPPPSYREPSRELEVEYEIPAAAAPEPLMVYHEEPAPPPPPQRQPQAPMNELDVPAFLRRDRRIYQ